MVLGALLLVVWLGKMATHAAATGIVLVAGGVTCLVFPPATYLVMGTVGGTIAVPTEILSNAVGLSTGIVLGAATGPV